MLQDFNKLPLTESDLLMLGQSYITPELAEQARIFRVDSPSGAFLVGQKNKKKCAGIVFPYFYPEQIYPCAYRLRRDEPDYEKRADGSLKEVGKYLSAKGSRNKIYFPPNTLKEWLTDISLPLIITEGEKKTLALWRLAWYGLGDAAERPHFLPIGLAGVWTFRGTIGKALNADGQRVDVKGIIPDFHLFEWQNRKTTILFDANVNTNDKVKTARLVLSRELKK